MIEMNYPFFCFTQNEAKLKVINILVEELLEKNKEEGTEDITFSLDWVKEKYRELSGYSIDSIEAEELCYKILNEISRRLNHIKLSIDFS